MANSITASTVSPFTGLLLSDSNYYVTASFPSASAAASSSPSLFFPNVDYPTVGKFIVQVSNPLLGGSAGGVSSFVTLQESNDNSTWNNVAPYSSSVLTLTDSSGTIAASSQQLLLTPKAKPYLRIQVTVPAGGSSLTGISGSTGVVLQALF